MAGALVSIVIPVYNAEKYILRSTTSALSQTYEDIEVVVVDDGSTDGSLEILKAIEDNRLKVISSENRGPGAARNTGVEKSTGKYILYLDSDDEIAVDTVKRCIDEIEKSSVDVVTFDTRVEGKSDIFRPGYDRKIEAGIHKAKDYLIDDTPCVVWLYFFKRSLLEKSKLKFIEGIIHEDRGYTPMLLKAARRIRYINEVLHTRHLVEESIMTRKKSIYNIESKQRVVEYLKQNKIKEGFIRHLWWSMYTDIQKIEDKKTWEEALNIMKDIRRKEGIEPSFKQKIKLQILRFIL